MDRNSLAAGNFIRNSVIAISLLLAVLSVERVSGQTIAPASGKAMCSALTPADFTEVGVPASQLCLANLDDSRSAYCIYDNKEGKVEFDIFYPAGETPSDAQNAVRAAQGAIGGKFEPVKVSGADDANTNAGSSRSANSDSILVRTGTTVFNIGIPHSSQGSQRLITLSGMVISRAKK